MKKIFEILQKPWCPVILGIIFLSVPKWTKDFGLGATYVILFASAFVALLLLWNLLAKWGVTAQGYLIANGGGAFTGIVSSLVILTFTYGDMNEQQLNLFLLISFCMGVVIIGWGIFFQWCVKPWKDDKGQAPSPFLPEETTSLIEHQQVLRIGHNDS
jgi:hypothetical protein